METKKIKMVNDILENLKNEYSEFVSIAGKNDHTAKHIKGKIEGIEYMINLFDLK